MTLLAEIQAAFPDLSNRDDGLIAATLSQGRTKIVSRQIGIGTILDALGPTDGAAVLDALDALRTQSSIIKWAWHLLDRGELDIGLASTRAQIDALVPGVFTQVQADALKALAVAPDVVTPQDVAKALEGV